ncbi:hypothetical protein Hamer_G022976 [Homarus americanus]|uniref:Uncharacterized protein n=1 Tax=Homarus americanus TaxID=6706 RepID=A0A8J5K5D8_HOMAM|nr:hypothetical protein Hamer_G022976 [Homarus americanus]
MRFLLVVLLVAALGLSVLAAPAELETHHREARGVDLVSKFIGGLKLGLLAGTNARPLAEAGLLAESFAQLGDMRQSLAAIKVRRGRKSKLHKNTNHYTYTVTFDVIASAHPTAHTITHIIYTTAQIAHATAHITHTTAHIAHTTAHAIYTTTHTTHLTASPTPPPATAHAIYTTTHTTTHITHTTRLDRLFNPAMVLFLFLAINFLCLWREQWNKALCWRGQWNKALTSDHLPAVVT